MADVNSGHWHTWRATVKLQWEKPALQSALQTRPTLTHLARRWLLLRPRPPLLLR